MWIMTAQLNAELLLQSAKQIFRGADADGDRAVDADEFHAYLAEEVAAAEAAREEPAGPHRDSGVGGPFVVARGKKDIVYL